MVANREYFEKIMREMKFDLKRSTAFYDNGQVQNRYYIFELAEEKTKKDLITMLKNVSIGHSAKCPSHAGMDCYCEYEKLKKLIEEQK